MNETEFQEFLNLCRNSSFKYKDEILNGIESGGLKLARRSKMQVPAEQMLDIYESRTKHLKSFSTEHAEKLRKDTLIYCQNLEKNLNEKIDTWDVEQDKVWGYLIFEGTNSQKILGCLWVADKRYMSNEEVEENWGMKNNI